jgi:hypothetical protein
MTAECGRCDSTFQADSRHVHLEWSWYPPETRAEAIAKNFDALCPSCTQDFHAFMRVRE